MNKEKEKEKEIEFRCELDCRVVSMSDAFSNAGREGEVLRPVVLSYIIHIAVDFGFGKSLVTSFWQKEIGVGRQVRPCTHNVPQKSEI